MLRNRRGATSALRWLRALLDHGVEVHGQVVCCPGVNDGAVLADTLAGVLDRYPELASLCVVPLGVSRHNTEARMRPATAGRGGRRDRRRPRRPGALPAGAGPPSRVRRRRVLPDRRPSLPRARRLRGLRHARGRHRHGPHLRARVPRRRRRASGGVESGFFAWADAAETGRTTRYEAAGDLGAPAEGYRAVRGGCAVEVAGEPTPAPAAVALRPRPPGPTPPSAS